MTRQQLEALKYIENSNGGSTRKTFFADHEPIGLLLWKDIREFVVEDNHGGLWLREEGSKLIEKDIV